MDHPSLRSFARQFAVSLFWLALLNPVPSKAATFNVTDYEATNRPDTFDFTPTCNAWLTGRIVQGDAQRVEAVLDDFARSKWRPHDASETTLASLRRDYRQGFYAVCLTGVGGDIREALKIAAHLDGWMTVVPANTVCESACAVIFMKGHRRNRVTGTDNTRPGRFLYVTAKLGFHLPILGYPSDSKVSPSEVSDAYARALRTMRDLTYDPREDKDNNTPPGEVAQTKADFVGRSDLEGFMPRDLILAILLTPPNEMFYVTTVQQALYWGIDLVGVPQPEYIASEMLRIGCINMINMRCEAGGPFGLCLKSRKPAFAGQSPPLTSARGSIKDILLWELAYGFEYAQGRIWPPAGGQAGNLIVYGFRYGPEEWVPSRNKSACHARITFKAGKLDRLEIDTFNNAGSKLLTATKNDRLISDPMELGEADLNNLLAVYKPPAFDQYGFRLWMMLPFSYKISDITVERKPWSALEEDGPYLKFDEVAPTSWLRGRKIETRDCALTWDGCPQ